MKAERKWRFVCPLLRFEAGAAGGAGGVPSSRREAGRRGGRQGAGGSPAQPGASRMTFDSGQGRWPREEGRDGRPDMTGPGMTSHVAADGDA